MNGDGTINVVLPKKDWEVSAVLVKSYSASTAARLDFILGNRSDAAGVSPAGEMRKFFDVFLKPVLTFTQVIAWLVTVVAAVSILVSIYNSVAARSKEIAILRALGATRRRVLALICLEAGMVALAGGVLGLIGGHAMAWAGSAYLEHVMGQGLAWWRVDGKEVIYLGIVVLIGLLAGLVPAMKAYWTEVAGNLTE